MIDYNEPVQELLIQMMLTDPSLFIRANPIINPVYFTSKKYSTVMQFMQDYAKEYGSLPTPEEIKARTTVGIQKIQDFNPGHARAALDTVEEFCKQRAVEVAVLKAADLLQKGQRDSIQSLIKEASLVSLQRELGTNYFSDPKARLDRLHELQANLSTGWSTIDKVLNGGFGWGELELFIAPSGGGKSVTLANQAVIQVQNGFDVLYITLELKEELVAQRLDAMVTGTAIWDIKKQVDQTTMLVLDYKRNNPKSGNLYIKYMRPDVTNTLAIESYLNELEVQTGVRPNVILVDYMDLMGPNDRKISIENLSMKDKMVSQELRALAADRTARGINCSVITAAQVNRCLDLDSVVQLSDGSTKKIRDIRVGDRIRAYIGWNTVKKIYPVTRQVVYEIELESGESIVCSERHIFPARKASVPDESRLTSIELGMVVGDSLYAKHGLTPISSITELEERETIDIELDGDRVFYANGILTHNSGMEELEFSMAGVAGGLTKIYSSDNVAVFVASKPMRDREEAMFQFLKTRNSAAVGMKIMMKYDQRTLRILDAEDNTQSNESGAQKFLNRKRAEEPKPELSNPEMSDKPVNTDKPMPTAAPALTANGASKLRELLNRNRTLG